MWLIETSTLQLKLTSDPQTVRYAILSHTWQEGEVSYQDFADLNIARQKAGFGKIEKTCQLALNRGLKYAWVDTCCIDKTSSAELSEAINSMFQWYKWSEVCFVHIEDLPASLGGPRLDWLLQKDYLWFARGWTLQELIAPTVLEFYDQKWEPRGDKTNLRAKLSRITGIDAQVLADSAVVSEVPVARRMAWAAKRKTTRREDEAYCLLGIFDVNMPMIYGEGSKAFRRLQEEIARESNDLSLFAWMARKDNREEHLSGILARSPAEFIDCGNIVRYKDYLAPNAEFVLTNNGLRIDTSIGLTKTKDYVLGLNCVWDRNNARYQWLGIYLCKTASGFVRQFPGKLFDTLDPQVWLGERSTIYIKTTLSAAEQQQIQVELTSRIYIKYLRSGQYAIEEKVSSPDALWNANGDFFLTMESIPNHASVANNTAYPLFTGYKGFNIVNVLTNVHICSCLLICGIFEDIQGRRQPCAVVYTDKESSTMDIFHRIKNHKGQTNGALLGQIRDFVISKHSPGRRALTWRDVAERTTETWTGVDSSGEVTVSIALTITLTDDQASAQIPRHSASPRQLTGTNGRDILSLPDDYFESPSNKKCYNVFVNILANNGPSKRWVSRARDDAMHWEDDL